MIEIPPLKRQRQSREPSLARSEFSSADSSAFDYGVEEEIKVCLSVNSLNCILITTDGRID